MRKQQERGREKTGKGQYVITQILIVLVFSCLLVLCMPYLFRHTQPVSLPVYIIMVLLVYFVNIIVHETGHLLFGLLTGYQLISFRIGNLLFYKAEGRVRLRLFGIAGTAGQCLMSPPEGEGADRPYLLYNLGGVIANLVFGLLCLALHRVLPGVPYLPEFLLYQFLCGALLAMLNGVPMKTQFVENDGYNMICLKKDPVARFCFFSVLEVNALLMQGVRAKDLPVKHFSLPEAADLSNPKISSMKYLEFCCAQDQHDFIKAQKLGKFLLENAVLSGVQRLVVEYELLFYELLGECREAEIRRGFTKELQKYFKRTKHSISTSRWMYAYALLLERDEGKAARQLAIFETAAKAYPYPGEAETERELVALVQKKAREGFCA